jgi:hypothetical protein
MSLPIPLNNPFFSSIQPSSVVPTTVPTTQQHEEDPNTSDEDNNGQQEATAVAVSAVAVHGKEDETVPVRPVDAVEEDLARAREATNTLKNRSRVNERTSAISSFKERLKKR